MFHAVNIGKLGLESGETLKNVRLVYSTFGTLNMNRDNVILIYHGLTGNSLVTNSPHKNPILSVNETLLSESGTIDDIYSSGWGIRYDVPWWGEVVGENKCVDTRKWFVICFNCLGSCYGSTGPMEYVKRWGEPFPQISVRDQVNATVQALHHLEIKEVHAVVGASLGGMQALETVLNYPHLTTRVWLGAVGARATAEQIGSQITQIEAIKTDPLYQEGFYDDRLKPVSGLALARKIGHMTYRGIEELDRRFANTTATAMGNAAEGENSGEVFSIESYLNNRAEELVGRFDANSYITLTQALNTYDTRNSFKSAYLPHMQDSESMGVNQVEKGKFLDAVMVVHFEGDKLQPLPLQEELASQFPPQVVNRWREVSSIEGVREEGGVVRVDTQNGHDGFLTESEKVGGLLRTLIEYKRE